MTYSRTLASFLLLTAAGLLSAGCAPVQKSCQCGKGSPAADVSVRLERIQNHVRILNGITWELPGATDPANRAAVAACFSELTEILPLIEGDERSSEFRVGIRILQDARAQLTAAGPDQSVEPVISSGLRATERLLRGLNRSHFDNDAAMTKQLDVLQKKVGELDTSHDSMNRVYAAQTLRNTTSILEQMSASLMERSGIETKPAAKADAPARQ